MKIRLDRTKMAMNGNFFAYDASVPVSEVDRSRFSYFIVRDGEHYVTLNDATRPAELDAMPRGMARYDAFMAHSKAAEATAWDLIQANFPELAEVSEQQLFVNLPNFEASHATLFVEAA